MATQGGTFAGDFPAAGDGMIMRRKPAAAPTRPAQ